MRYVICQKWDIHELRSFIGANTTQLYQAWASQEKREALTDILPEKAKLHWIGPRQEGSGGCVLLFFFGIPWLSAFCIITDLSQNDIRRRSLFLAPTTRLLSIPTRSPESRICFLRQF